MTNETSSNPQIDSLRSRLPVVAIRLLDCKDGKYSEWATASSIAMHCMNAGFTEDEYIEFVSASDFAYEFASENGRDRTDRLHSRLSKVWTRAEDNWNPPLPQGDLRVRLGQLLDRVTAHRWSGRAGASQRLVAQAVVSKGFELNKWTVDVSVRDVAVAAGVGKTTAARALKNIAETGLWRVQANGKGQSATVTLNLRWEDERAKWDTQSSMGGEASVSRYAPSGGTPETPLRDQITHPVFLRSALGPNAERIWFKLADSENALSASELSQVLGIHASTVRRTMERLVTHGMATKAPGRPARYSFVSVSTEHLDRIAEEYGVLDWEQRVNDRIKREREGYAALRAQQEARTNTDIPQGHETPSEPLSEPRTTDVFDPFAAPPAEAFLVYPNQPLEEINPVQSFQPWNPAPPKLLEFAKPTSRPSAEARSADEPDWAALEAWVNDSVT